MKGALSYATVGFRDRDLGAALEAVAAADFPSVEISCQEPHLTFAPVGQALGELTAQLSKAGIRAATVHAPMRENVLGAPDETWRRERVRVLASYLRFAADVGAAGMVIHPVPNPIFVTDPDRPELPQIIVDAARRSLDDLAPVAVDAGVRMMLENLPYDCHYPLLTMTELRRLIDDYPDRAVGLVVDTGHAWTHGDDPADEIRAAGSRLWGTHLQDVDGDEPADNHWVPSHGDLDWAVIGAALDEVGYRGQETFEVIVPRHGESPEELARLTRDFARTWGDRASS